MLSRRQFYIFFFVLVCTFCSVLYLLADNLVQTPTGNGRYGCSSFPAVSTETAKRFSPTYLLIIIMSHGNDSSTRAVIRDTWLKLSAKGPSQVRHLFSIGTKGLSESNLRQLYDEQEQFDDMLLLPSHVDTYENLARKTAQSFKAAIQELNFDFVLKVDSDSFVRLGSFFKALKDIAHPMLYWGFLDGRAKPFRKGKWKEKDWMLCDRYLPYQLGGGYVLSYRLANYIAVNVDLLKYYRSEDVSVGAWLAGLDVKYVHDPRFDTEFRSRGCSNQYLITHKQNAVALKQLFENVRDLGQLCTKEVQLRASYVYDWSALPSQCCTRSNSTHIP
uniref:Hexosyltransferase n=1 Tax=Steinernema glaseri TaxID=37863 RepID=A0A1I7ZNE1_9BILA